MIMKYYFIVFVSLLFLNNIQGQNYWQQKADYKISVDVNVKNNKYKGYQEIRYTNNSRDTLNKIFFHLYFNAFRPESDMAERLISADDSNKRFNVNLKNLKPEEQGYLEVSNIKQDNINLNSDVSDTILEIILANPLLPGETSLFTMC